MVNGFQVFMNVLKKKQGRSKDGFIWAYQEKGKPIRLHSVPQVINFMYQY